MEVIGCQGLKIYTKLLMREVGPLFFDILAYGMLSYGSDYGGHRDPAQSHKPAQMPVHNSPVSNYTPYSNS